MIDDAASCESNERDLPLKPLIKNSPAAHRQVPKEFRLINEVLERLRRFNPWRKLGRKYRHPLSACRQKMVFVSFHRRTRRRTWVRIVAYQHGGTLTHFYAPRNYTKPCAV